MRALFIALLYSKEENFLQGRVFFIDTAIKEEKALFSGSCGGVKGRIIFIFIC